LIERSEIKTGWKPPGGEAKNATLKDQKKKALEGFKNYERFRRITLHAPSGGKRDSSGVGGGVQKEGKAVSHQKKG